MSQEQLEQYSYIASMIVTLINAVLFYSLWNIFFHSAKEKVTVIAGCALLLISLAFGFYVNLPGRGRIIICAALILCYSFARYKKHCGIAVFIMTLHYSLRSLSWIISNSISQGLNNIFFNRIIDESYSNEKLFLCSFIVIMVFFILLIIFYIIMLLILKRMIKLPGDMNWYDVCFLSVLNIVSILFVGVIADISVVPLDADTFVLLDNKTEMLWILPLIAVLLFSGELAAVTLYQKYRGLMVERELYFIEQQQIKAMKQRLEEAEGFYGNIRKVRHEMKNHLTNVKSLIAGRKYDDVEDYIAKLDVNIGELTYKYTTGNAITDVIINDKGKIAEKAGIRFDADFFYDGSDGIDVFDMGIILNNLLDNAVTACENDVVSKPENRYIRLELKRKKKFLLIIVENSFEGDIHVADDGLIKTTKDVCLPEILMEHGVGLRNVRDIAERYFGTIDITADNNIFKTTVMLQQKSTADNTV